MTYAYRSGFHTKEPKVKFKIAIRLLFTDTLKNYPEAESQNDKSRKNQNSKENGNLV